MLSFFKRTVPLRCLSYKVNKELPCIVLAESPADGQSIACPENW